MKKLFVISLLFTISLFADSKTLMYEIIGTVLDNLSTPKQKIIYSDDKDLLKALSKHYAISQTCQESTFIILQKEQLPKECQSKDIFVLNYNLLRSVPQSIGAFFFQKGRANIVLLQPKLQKHNIKASPELKPYLEEKIW